MVTPQPCRRLRRTGWTPARQRQFVTDLATSGNVREVCARIGLSRTSAYKFRDQPHNAAFARAWDAALDKYMGEIAGEAAGRVLDGGTRPVKYKGAIVGERVVISNRLLTALLLYRSTPRTSRAKPPKTSTLST
ncbi:MAG: hypothetical protein ACRYG4_06585 [Janthinobacterium lividum]